MPCRPRLQTNEQISGMFYEFLDTVQLDRAWCMLSDTAERALSESHGSGLPRSASWKPAPAGQRSKAANGRGKGLLSFNFVDFFVGCVSCESALKIHIWETKLLLKCTNSVVLSNGLVSSLILMWSFIANGLNAIFSSWRPLPNKLLFRNGAIIRRTSLQPMCLGSEAGKFSGWAGPQSTVFIPFRSSNLNVGSFQSMWSEMLKRSGWHVGVTSEPPQCEDVHRLLADLPRFSEASWECCFTAQALQKSARAMAGTAAGPDQWSVEAWLCLPEPFCEALAKFWTAVIHSGVVPERWREGRVVLLPKVGFRPVTILSSAWRIGARVLAWSLRPRVASWAGHQTLGGIFRRGVKDAFLRITASLQDDFFYVQEDLSKFFDTIRSPHLLLTLDHFGAPRQFRELVASYYQNHRRVGVVGQQWHPITCGVAQGCPLSPLLAAVIMNFLLSTSHSVEFADSPFLLISEDARREGLPVLPWPQRSISWTLVAPLTPMLGSWGRPMHTSALCFPSNDFRATAVG